MNNGLEQKSKHLPVIDATKCTGCEECVEVCPNDAIFKQANYDCLKCVKYCLSKDISCKPHHILFCYDNCDSCGLCIEACKSKALQWFDSAKAKCS